jgi:hypothetical protein
MLRSRTKCGVSKHEDGRIFQRTRGQVPTLILRDGALMVRCPPSPFETRSFGPLLRMRAGLEPRSLLRMRAEMAS